MTRIFPFDNPFGDTADRDLHSEQDPGGDLDLSSSRIPAWRIVASVLACLGAAGVFAVGELMINLGLSYCTIDDSTTMDLVRGRMQTLVLGLSCSAVPATVACSFRRRRGPDAGWWGLAGIGVFITVCAVITLQPSRFCLF